MPSSTSAAAPPASATPVFVLVGIMLLTGTMNTILNKLQDMQCVDNCDDPDPKKRHHFEQPVWQTINMFIGETMCLLVYYVGEYLSRKRADPAPAPHVAAHVPVPTDNIEVLAEIEEANEITPLVPGHPSSPAVPLEGWAVFLLWIPTLCDMTATTLMNVGLLFISASVYQMLRGSVVLFTAVFSTIFLGRNHPWYRWFALVTVFLGVALVGAASILQSSVMHASNNNPSSDAATAALGVFLVILAQSLTASQFVVEEKLIGHYNVPAIKAVGLEGLFGLLSAVILFPILYYTVGKDSGGYFDIPVGWEQMVGDAVIGGAAIGICFSIAFFNWSGLSVTRRVSATARSTIDTCRTVFIWSISLGLGWETFKSLQVVGFGLLIYGTFVFNDVIAPPKFLRKSAD
ncbi:hypothetical protein DFJ73DRAFT_859346 [Zopfochytrium polystomum]|nr:hypothetical protein DFJ73DRAFT_859346 [Zopfochytrium polystomum]